MKKKVMVIADTAELKAAFTEWQKLNSKAQKAAAAYADKAAALKVKHDTATAPMAERMAELEAGIKAYATAHKAELTNGKGKTAAVGSGFIKWRSARGSVQISSNVEAVIAELKRRRLSRLIRVKYEVNKTAVMDSAALLEKRPIDGLQIIKGGEEITLQA